MGAKLDASETYIASAPPAQRERLAELREMIRRHLPRARESIGGSGFPVFTDGDGKWLAGYATRKKGPMLYIMNSSVLDRRAAQLGKLRSGNSCIEWRENDVLSMDELRSLAEEMLDDVSGST